MRRFHTVSTHCATPSVIFNPTDIRRYGFALLSIEAYGKGIFHGILCLILLATAIYKIVNAVFMVYGLLVPSLMAYLMKWMPCDCPMTDSNWTIAEKTESVVKIIY